MSDDQAVGGELLKQNGLARSEVVQEESNEIRRLLERDGRRVGILRWLTIICFATPLAAFVSLAVCTAFVKLLAGPDPSSWWLALPHVLSVLSIPAIPLGVLSGIVLLFLSRSVDHRAIQARLAMLEARVRGSGPEE